MVHENQTLFGELEAGLAKVSKLVQFDPLTHKDVSNQHGVKRPYATFEKSRFQEALAARCGMMDTTRWVIQDPSPCRRVPF